MQDSASSLPILRRLAQWILRNRWLRTFYAWIPASLRTRVAQRMMAEPRAPVVMFPRCESWAAKRHPVTDAPVRFFALPQSVENGQGVNIFAYLRGQFGLAECARLYARALLGAGYPTALVDIDLNLPHGLDDRSLDSYIRDEAPYDIHLVFINPDYLVPAFESIGEARLRGKHIIACWFWELEIIPESWLPAIESVDEILVASEFVREAFACVTDKPVVCVPLPLSEVGDSGLQRVDFDIDAKSFVFLTSFDFNSYVYRKNPFAVIEAFAQAFPETRKDVLLLVKTSNGHRNPQSLRALLEKASADPRIVVRDQILDRADVHALQRCANVYVSLHHAEGFGLGLAECMAQGKPVIGTGWSGNLAFMDSHNSALVNYAIVPVQEGEYAHHEGQRWARADIDDAAAWMRRLADDPVLARQLGARAQASVLETLSAERAASALIGWFERIHMQRRQRTVAVPFSGSTVSSSSQVDNFNA
ncbi:glycosyltransferase family 4 protein [Xanthomonas cassavae CFBP 4642]|uniref:Glycosyltransferase family 4 protein n=1 Tax=Xanthomonas cassavae CFBP 4642 TaxID=1219375 RepID=A0ABS8HEU4_9XANT|nr:glycosyltransferase family 4 protein [Xanthomonas cassavae]MCC4620699.1 glycosyltransferase family 4 protein [Xanthomonas cassavae CFBP 4642]